jgi:hypothetical protein
LIKNIDGIPSRIERFMVRRTRASGRDGVGSGSRLTV